ncbi:transmembrane protein 17B [Salarias fasciatus]|uniref:Transmembrane protein 17B-like n=1 Tax=Salarias fasciatus TaxID=181472 RepID=A0A672GR00_SALFA|nr:transmembrane protein 17B-like [Salarias fasciatus]
MDLPLTITRRSEEFLRNVLFARTQAGASSNDQDPVFSRDKRVLSNLQLQMSLYFNMWFFPLWWISETVMLHLKYHAIGDHYKFVLVTILCLMTLIEAIRLYLGYTGNLQEKLPELAGFWLLTILLQFPLILFQLLNEAILILPLERSVHIIFTTFILTQVFFGFAALRDIVRQREQFVLQKFD